MLIVNPNNCTMTQVATKVFQSFERNTTFSCSWQLLAFSHSSQKLVFPKEDTEPCGPRKTGLPLCKQPRYSGLVGFVVIQFSVPMPYIYSGFYIYPSATVISEQGIRACLYCVSFVYAFQWFGRRHWNAIQRDTPRSGVTSC